MIVHRLLDAFFRTLDAVDAVRDRVDRALGKEPRPDPWAVEWPPEPATADPVETEAPRAAPERAPTKNGATQRATPASPVVVESPPAKQKAAAPAQKAGQTSSTTSTTKTAQKAAKKSPAAKPKAPAKKANTSRKGSVDRSGKDFDSPRAKAIWEYVRDNRLGVVTEEAMLDGKKVLARVVWALSAAEAAGSELGLTTADASALLHLCARMEVYATNIGRACRDHAELVEESDPDGRSKRYRLTARGKALAVDIPTQAP